jgi:hypothetical protein
MSVKQIGGQNGHTMIMFIKPTSINLKGVWNSTRTQNVVVASLVVL